MNTKRNEMLFLTVPDSQFRPKEAKREPDVVVTLNDFPPDLPDEELADLIILDKDEEVAKKARELWKARHKHEEKLGTFKLRIAHGNAWGDI